MTGRIRIKFGQIEFEAEGDTDLIEREREQFFSFLPQAINAVSSTIMMVEQPKMLVDEILLEESENTHSQQTIDISSGGNLYDSLVTFLKEKNFQNDVERVMGVAYYVDCIEKSGPITAKEIEARLLEARQGKPSNTNSFINENIKKAYLCEHPDKKDGYKAFYVLADGVKWCENYTAPENIIKKRTGKSKKTKVKESDLIKIPLDELNLDKYIDISQLDNFREQLLVVMLIYTREKNIEFFTNNDLISVLKNKFKVPATDNQISGVFRRGGTLFDKKVENHIAYHKMLSGAIKEADSIITREKNK